MEVDRILLRAIIWTVTLQFNTFSHLKDYFNNHIFIFSLNESLNHTENDVVSM